MLTNWAAMLPPGTRNMAVQLATTSGVFATITQEPASSPTCLPWEKSWSRKTISSPSAKGEFGSRSLFAAMGVNGLNTTSKVSVVDLAAAGSAACDAAELDITPTRPSTKAEAEPIKATLRMVPSSRPANRPLHASARTAVSYLRNGVGKSSEGGPMSNVHGNRQASYSRSRDETHRPL